MAAGSAACSTTCKWELECYRGDFMVGCPLAAAAVLSCRVQSDRWITPHLAVRTLFDCYVAGAAHWSADTGYGDQVG